LGISVASEYDAKASGIAVLAANIAAPAISSDKP
jgi:hypothetical protein